MAGRNNHSTRPASGDIEPLIATALSWPDVTLRRMFGADCFLVGGHMFAFAWRGDVALWVADSDYLDAAAQQGVRPVEIRVGIPMGTWLFFPGGYGAELLPRLRASYEHYLQEPTQRRRRARAKAR